MTKNDVRSTLRRIVSEQGVAVCNEPSRVQAYLRDLCPDQKREVFAVVAAMKEGLVSDLNNFAPSQGAMESVFARLTAKLFDNTGIIPQTARWAVESWALALGIIKEPISSGVAPPVTFEPALGQVPAGSPPVAGLNTIISKAVPSLKLVQIPAGEFWMGASDNDSEAQPDERPQHLVRITKPFYMATTPVTQRQWKAVMKTNNSHFRDDDRPVADVSWDDAKEFCKRLSALEGLPVAKGYRLPTEAEWEYAARGGTTGARYGDLDSVAWFGSNSGSNTHPVGQKSPNAYGLYDMLGNVWEWCEDWYDKDWYSRMPEQNPLNNNSSQYRVVHGGSWGNIAGSVRASYRYWFYPDGRHISVGFRISRD